MNGYFKAIPAIVGVFVLGLAGPLAAAEVSVGLSGAWQSSPYKGHDDRALPAPFISIDADRFYLRGPDAGVRAFRNGSHDFSLGLSYGGPEFDSDDTDDRRLKRLDDRDPTLGAYFRYTLTSDYGIAGLRLLHDVLGHSKALSAEAFYKYPFAAGPLHVSPGAGLAWDSKDQLGYYYGVSAGEARKSGLEQYDPEAGISPFLFLEAEWNFTESWSVIAAGKVQFLSQEIQDSPMVDDGRVLSTLIGFKYRL